MNKTSKSILKKVLDKLDDMEHCTIIPEAYTKASAIYYQIKKVAEEEVSAFRMKTVKFKFDGEMMEDINDLRDAMAIMKTVMTKIRYWKKYHYDKLKDSLDKVTTIIFSVIQ